MKYFLMREDQLTEIQRHALENKNTKSFDHKELIEMNCLARLECLRGNKKLNQKLLQVTEELTSAEVKANFL